MGLVAAFLRDVDLSVVTSDRRGGFVAMPAVMGNNKAGQTGEIIFGAIEVKLQS